MYNLDHIIKQNQEAERLGIIKPGSAVGTTGFIPGQSGTNHGHVTSEQAKPAPPENSGQLETQPHDSAGLRGHSKGGAYPFTVAAGAVTDTGTSWTVMNAETGRVYNTYRGLAWGGACRAAHAEAQARKEGVAVKLSAAVIVAPFNQE